MEQLLKLVEENIGKVAAIGECGLGKGKVGGGGGLSTALAVASSPSVGEGLTAWVSGMTVTLSLLSSVVDRVCLVAGISAGR